MTARGSPVSAAVRSLLVEVDEDARVAERSSACRVRQAQGVSSCLQAVAQDEERLTAVASGNTALDQADRLLLDQLDRGEWSRLENFGGLFKARSDHSLGTTAVGNVLQSVTFPPPIED